MKKRLLTICTLMALALALIPAAAAAKEAVEAAKESGFYSVQEIKPDTTKLTPMAADQAAGVPGQSVTIDGQTVVQHPGSVRFAIEMQGEPNGMYFVQVDEGDLAAPDLTKSVYVNQYTADAAGTVSSGTGTEAPYPGTLIAGKTYSVFANNEKIATLKYFGAGIEVNGVVSSYNGKNPVTVTLYDSATDTVKYSITLQRSETVGQIKENYKFDAVAAGNYNLVFTKDGHLKYTIKGIEVGDQPLDLSIGYPATLIPGDLDKNGKVNAMDLGYLIQPENYNQLTDKAQNALADLDGSGKVNAMDLGYLIQPEHYNHNENENFKNYTKP